MNMSSVISALNDLNYEYDLGCVISAILFILVALNSSSMKVNVKKSFKAQHFCYLYLFQTTWSFSYVSH